MSEKPKFREIDVGSRYHLKIGWANGNPKSVKRNRKIDLDKRKWIIVGGGAAILMSSIPLNYAIKAATGESLWEIFAYLADKGVSVVPEETRERKINDKPYSEVLPLPVFNQINSTCSTFGLESVVNNLEVAGKKDGFPILKLPENGSYDCVIASKNIADILTENERLLKENIDGYSGFKSMYGIDERGVYYPHSWVELVIKECNEETRVPIDLNPHYKGKSPRHFVMPRKAEKTDSKGIDMRDAFFYLKEHKFPDYDVVSAVKPLFRVNGKKISAFRYGVMIAPYDDDQKASHIEAHIEFGANGMNIKEITRNDVSVDYDIVRLNLPKLRATPEELGNYRAILDSCLTKDRPILEQFQEKFNQLE